MDNNEILTLEILLSINGEEEKRTGRVEMDKETFEMMGLHAAIHELAEQAARGVIAKLTK